VSRQKVNEEFSFLLFLDTKLGKNQGTAICPSTLNFLGKSIEVKNSLPYYFPIAKNFKRQAPSMIFSKKLIHAYATSAPCHCYRSKNQSTRNLFKATLLYTIF